MINIIHIHSKVQKLAILHAEYRTLLVNVCKCYQGIWFFKKWCAMNSLFHTELYLYWTLNPTFAYAHVIMWLLYPFPNSLCHHAFLPSCIRVRNRFSKPKTPNSVLGCIFFMSWKTLFHQLFLYAFCLFKKSPSFNLNIFSLYSSLKNIIMHLLFLFSVTYCIDICVGILKKTFKGNLTETFQWFLITK